MGKKKKANFGSSVGAALAMARAGSAAGNPVAMAPTWGGYDVSTDFDPERAWMILQLANGGGTQQQSMLAREILEKDSDIAHAWNVRSSALLGLDWELEGGTSEQRAYVYRIIESISPDFDSGLVDFRGLCSNLALAAMHGFTASRIDWGPGGASINGFHCPPHSWYAVDIQKQIPYLSTEQGGKILPAQGSWLLHRYGTAGSEIQRSGLIRPLAFLYAFKRLSMVWYARYLEKFGTPAVAAKISERWEDVDNKVRADVGELLSLWSNDASFIVPQDFELSFLAPQQGGADQYLQSLKYFQSQAWRLLLGQDMTSTGASSNRASAEVGKSISYSIMQHEAQALSETLTAQLIKPIIQNAYGFTANAPRFKFMLQTPDDLQAKAAALQMMGQAGYMLADDNIARQFLGYPIVRIQPAAVAHPAATSPEPAK